MGDEVKNKCSVTQCVNFSEWECDDGKRRCSKHFNEWYFKTKQNKKQGKHIHERAFKTN